MNSGWETLDIDLYGLSVVFPLLVHETGKQNLNAILQSREIRPRHDRLDKFVPEARILKAKRNSLCRAREEGYPTDSALVGDFCWFYAVDDFARVTKWQDAIVVLDTLAALTRVPFVPFYAHQAAPRVYDQGSSPEDVVAQYPRYFKQNPAEAQKIHLVSQPFVVYAERGSNAGAAVVVTPFSVPATKETLVKVIT